MTILPLAALLGLLPSSAPAETIQLRSGARVSAPLRSLDAQTVTLQDGRVFPRSEVQEIQFALKGEAQPAAAADPAAVERGRELFRQAEAFGKEHPGSDGLILVDDGDFVYRDDGTWVERYRFAGKLLKEGLQRDWGRVTGHFEEGRERVRILRATVYHPDGAIFPLDPAKIQTTRPQGDALFFTEERLLTYPLPQVEVGDIVEWETETETYNPFRKDFFFPRWGFQSEQPALLSRVRITVPASQRLHYLARNCSGPWSRCAEAQLAQGARSTTYSWELRDVAPIVPEPKMAGYWDYAPSLKAALFKDWDRVFDWLTPMYKERTQPGPELAQFARTLVRDCKTDDDKVAAIYHYIQKTIRYVAVKMGVASGWGGYDANLTWKRRYGCCIDKALLFSAMLNAVGIESSPVLLDTNHGSEHDFRLPDIAFEHAITYLKLAGRGFFLDSTGYDFRYPAFPEMDHGSTALNVFHRTTTPIVPPRPEDNAARYEYAIELSSAGEAEVRFTARYTPGAREGDLRGYYKSLKESERKKAFEDWVHEVGPSGELIEYRLGNVDDIAKPFSISMRYRLPDYPIRAGDLYVFKLPDFEQSFPEVALGHRRYAMKYDTTFQKRYHYSVALPPHFQAASLLAPTKLRGPAESFSARCASTEGRVTCDADLKLAARVFSTAEYPAHKAFLEKVSRLSKDRIFLRAGEAP